MAFSKVSEMLLRTTGRSKSLVIFGVSGPPTNLVASNVNTGTIGLTWSAPSSVPGSPVITSYTIFVSGGTTTQINTGNANTSYTFTGGVKGTSYTFAVVANNAGGSSAQSNSVTSTVLGNDASGGTVTTVSNYNGTGQSWRVHEFTSNGALTFSMANQPVRVYIGGGNGGGGSSGCCGSCSTVGNYGGQYIDNSFTVNAQAYPIVIGNGGAAVGWRVEGFNGNPGGTSSFAGVSRSGGAGGGCCVFGGTTPGGSFTTSNIRGSGDQNIGSQTWGTGCGDGVGGAAGIAGRVIVAYRLS
jgi:hypothetical protein